MEQIDRIEAMEQCFNRAQVALCNLEKAWEDYRGVEDDFAQLDSYLGSPEWHVDREADASGQLPPTLHRGVLSEDSIWNLLQARKELLQDIHD